MRIIQELVRLGFSYNIIIAKCIRYAFYGLMLVLLWADPVTVFSAGEEEIAASAPELPLKAAPDLVIEKRLQAVIANIDDFQDVKIEVNEGVVRLSGKTSRVGASENVAQMVSRFEGVIYVDNQIQVQSDVETRVKPALTRAKQYLTNTVQKLPVIGVALVVVFGFWMISLLVTRWDLLYKRLGLNRLATIRMRSMRRVAKSLAREE